MLEERPSVFEYAPHFVFFARSRLTQTFEPNINAVDLNFADGAEFIGFLENTINGSVGGDCVALAELRALAIFDFEPCEKHAQTRKRPPYRTEPVAENCLERHGEDIEVIISVIDAVVSIHHVK